MYVVTVLNRIWNLVQAFLQLNTGFIIMENKKVDLEWSYYPFPNETSELNSYLYSCQKILVYLEYAGDCSAMIWRHFKF